MSKTDQEAAVRLAEIRAGETRSQQRYLEKRKEQTAGKELVAI